MSASNVSYDLVWQVARTNSAYLVKRPSSGGVYFSAEPLNVTGLYTKSASGFANPTAVGVVSSGNSVKLLRKSGKAFNKPSKAVSASTFHPYKDARKVALSVSKNTVSHRDDLLEAAVRKASALTRARKVRKSYAPVSRR